MFRIVVDLCKIKSYGFSHLGSRSSHSRNPASIYFFKVATETLEEYVKYVQS